MTTWGQGGAPGVAFTILRLAVVTALGNRIHLCASEISTWGSQPSGEAVDQSVWETSMLSSEKLRLLQRDQHAHDLRNHFDILSMHKTDRLKHYGLHFAKYVGRLARGSDEPKPIDRTLADAFLVNLSAANTLMQDLGKEELIAHPFGPQVDSLRLFADAAGRFADACEKIDHMEEFTSIAKTANRDITEWLLWVAGERGIDLVQEVVDRRKELAARHFYIAD